MALLACVGNPVPETSYGPSGISVGHHVDYATPVTWAGSREQPRGSPGSRRGLHGGEAACGFMKPRAASPGTADPRKTRINSSYPLAQEIQLCQALAARISPCDKPGRLPFLGFYAARPGCADGLPLINFAPQ